VSLVLYYAPQTRAFRARWLLEELAVPYELRRIDLARGEQRTPEYRRIHPLGAVPALVEGDQVIFESAAICLELADRFSDDTADEPTRTLAPPPHNMLRGAYYQWSIFAVATLDPIVAPIFARGFRWPSERRHETATDDEHERFARAVTALRVPLLQGAYLLNEWFTTADVLVGSVLAWAETVGLLRGASELEKYLRRLQDRPAYGRALTD
jgi:glutathione S-transferase